MIQFALFPVAINLILQVIINTLCAYFIHVENQKRYRFWSYVITILIALAFPLISVTRIILSMVHQGAPDACAFATDLTIPLFWITNFICLILFQWIFNQYILHRLQTKI